MTAKIGEGLPTPRRQFAVVALSFGTSLVSLDGSIANAALPTIAQALHVEASDAVLIVTVYQLVVVMCMLPIAALGDRIGHRRVYQAGQLIFLAATLGCVVAPNMPLLILARAGQALGAASVLGVSAAMIRLIYPAAWLGRGLAINTVIVSSTAALAPVIGALVLSHASWPWVFAVAAPPAFLSLVAGRFLPSSSGTPGRYDFRAAALCAAAVGTLITGLECSIHTNPVWIGLALFVAGVSLAVLFVRRELAQERPTVPVDLVRKPLLALSMLGAFIAFVGSMCVLMTLPFRLQLQFGLHPTEVGAVMSIWPLAMMTCAPISGILTDKVHPGKLGAIGATVATIGFVCLAMLPAHPLFLDFAWRMALCGAGLGTFLPTNGRLVIGAAPRDRVAAAGSMISTNRMIGQTLGATCAGALLALGWGSGKLPPFFAASLLLIAALFSVVRQRLPRLRRVDDDLVAVPIKPGV